MAITVTEIIDGVRMHLSLFDSVVRRCWEIDGLPVFANSTELLVAAVNAVGGLEFGIQHPTLPGLYVAEYDVRPAAEVSRTAVILFVDYHSPNRTPTLNAPLIEICGSNAQT